MIEMMPVVALAIAILFVGIYPAYIVDTFASGLQPIVDSFQGVTQATAYR